MSLVTITKVKMTGYTKDAICVMPTKGTPLKQHKHGLWIPRSIIKRNTTGNNDEEGEVDVPRWFASDRDLYESDSHEDTFYLTREIF